ncbi:MAG: efflux RND transporter permease subunit [Syntrophotaleaceae bacterium]
MGVGLTLSGIDVGTYVKNARQAVAEHIALPEGYNSSERAVRAHESTWSAAADYSAGPQCILVLIYLSTKSAIKTGIVFPGRALFAGGGLLAVYRSVITSNGVWVGLIARLGSMPKPASSCCCTDIAHKNWTEKGRMRNRGDLTQAIHHGAVKRIRPKVMTVITIIAGLFPIMWSTRPTMNASLLPWSGSVTSLVLEMLVYPVIFFI